MAFDLVKSIRQRDPANPTFAEVLLAYNGYHAVVIHRISYWLWETFGWQTVPRIMANIGRILTGVEIHPQAKIGKNLFIDHGTGVVIGQTAIIGDNVTMYHGVTLGGVGRNNETGRRHPIVEDGVMIGAGAQILGPLTIGEGAKIGANSVVTSDVPPHVTALGIPACVICSDDKAREYGLPGREEMETLAKKVDGLYRD